MTDDVTCLAAELLGVPIRLSVPAEVRDELATRLAPLAASGSALDASRDTIGLRVERDGAGFTGRTTGGGEVSDPDPCAVAVAVLTAEVVTRSPLLCMHAGVVACRDGVLAVPGMSGHGKTTLTAALVLAGCGYVSDEVLAVTRPPADAWPLRRPLALHHDVWPLLGLPVGDRPAPGTERLVDPAALGRPGPSGPVRHVLLTRRTGDAPSLRPAPRSSAVALLLWNSFNHFVAPRESFAAAVEIVRSAQVWTGTYRDAPDLAELVAREVGVL